MAKKPQKELGGRQLSTGTKIVVAVFAVIMALSMMLPMIAQVFAGRQVASSESAEQAESATEEAAQTDEKTDEKKDADEKAADEKATEEEAAVPDNETLKSLAEQYDPKVDKYKKRLESDPKNLAALLNLGQTYMNWGYSATYSSSTDEETNYSKGLLNKAVKTYDDYLALNDSPAVKVDKALCQYYAGDTDKAIKALEKMTKDDPSYPLAWANLGMLYETQNETEKATEAYRKAVETDENDEYGAKSYGNRRLIALNSTVSSPGDAGDASIDNLSTNTNSGLTGTLANDSGVGF